MDIKSDIKIQDDVLAEISLDPKIKASNIGVEVSEGVVTLTGYVQTYSEKKIVEKAVRRLDEAHAIAQEIQVLVPGSHIRSDTEIARQVQSIIKWSDIDTNDQIHIKVEQGFVTLSGKVESSHQKDIAQSYTSNMLGVKGVINLIEIEPKLSIPIIKQNIQDALTHQAIDDAERIHVAINKNTVTMAGKVKNWSEKNCVINAARLTPKVKNVIDRLQIEN